MLKTPPLPPSCLNCSHPTYSPHQQVCRLNINHMQKCRKRTLCINEALYPPGAMLGCVCTCTSSHVILTMILSLSFYRQENPEQKTKAGRFKVTLPAIHSSARSCTQDNLNTDQESFHSKALLIQLITRRFLRMLRRPVYEFTHNRINVLKLESN